MAKKVMILAAGCLLVGAAHANLLTNGGFENNSDASNVTDSTGLNGWTLNPAFVYGGVGVTENTVQVLKQANGVGGNGAWFSVLPATGDRFLAVNGNENPGTPFVIEQAFTLPSAAPQLRISFDYVNLYLPSLNTDIRAELITDGGTILLGDAFTSDTTWRTFSTLVTTPTGSSAKLRLTGLTVLEQGNDFGLDNVTVEAVPEPGTLAALGLGAIALLRRRRRN